MLDAFINSTTFGLKEGDDNIEWGSAECSEVCTVSTLLDLANTIDSICRSEYQRLQCQV